MRTDGKHDSGVNTRLGLEPYVCLPPQSTFEDPNEESNALQDEKTETDTTNFDKVKDDTTNVDKVADDTASLQNNDELREPTGLAKSSSVTSTTKKKRKVTTFFKNLFLCGQLCCDNTISLCS